jgi:hypothetical protein
MSNLRSSYRRVATLCVAVISAVSIGCGGGPQTTSSGQPPAIPSPSPGPSQNPPDTISPTIAISSPSSTGSYTSADALISVAGTASDNVGVKRVTWRNSTTGASGTAGGTSTWNVAGVALAVGVNNLMMSAEDAAGNTATASLRVTYAVVGQGGLVGAVDSSLINRNGANAIYLYSGDVTPDDRGGAGAQPLQVAPVIQDDGACTWSYRFDLLSAGTYTVAFTNQVANDNPSTNDAISFVGKTTVALGSGGGIVQNFAPTGRVLRVGPGRTFTVPSAAAAAAQPGDIIEIDAAAYDSDAATWDQNRLTLRGVGGRAHLRSNGAAVQGKGIWVISGNDVVVENVEFSGAAVPDLNGAGIRADGSNLTICNSYFHDNQEGILGGAGNVLIEYSEFARNGNCIDPSGCAHNIYIDPDAQRFTLRYSYSHHAREGHTVKSRARENFILFNRIMDESDGNASYIIDIPDGGRTFIIGNLIQQGPLAENSTMVAYGAESGANGVLDLYVVNNTFVNDRGSGTFVDIRGGTSGKIMNNIFAGGGSTPSGSGSLAVNTNITSATPPGLVDRVNFDYRLTASSSARDAGADPGVSANGVSLTPISEYVHPTNRRDRPVVGTIDVGAYEFQP